MKRRSVIAGSLGLAAALIVAEGPAQADPPPPGVRFRIATQAPEGTIWMDALEDIKAEVERRSRGRVEFQYYPNGSQGDERAVIERMEQGVLHGGLFTGIGLGEILPEIRILECPFFFRNPEEIDAVKLALEERFAAGFEERGFVFLGWAEVGWAYVWSLEEARNLEELRGLRIWRWQGDPLAEKTFQTFQLNGVPLSLTDVLTSLESGLIDAVYNSPYGLVGLQWHRDVGFMSRMNVGYGTGALLVSKAEWDKLPARAQEGIQAVARERLEQLVVDLRERNDATIGELQDGGLEVCDIPEDEVALYRRLGEQVAEEMTGVLWPREVLEQVQGIVGEMRSN